MKKTIRVTFAVSLLSIGLWAGPTKADLTPGTDWILPNPPAPFDVPMACRNGSPVSTFVAWGGSGGFIGNEKVWASVSGDPQNFDLTIEADATIQAGPNPYYNWGIGYFQGECPLPGDNWITWLDSLRNPVVDGVPVDSKFIPVTTECAVTSVTWNEFGYEPYEYPEIAAYNLYSLAVVPQLTSGGANVPTGDAVWTFNVDVRTCTFPEAEEEEDDEEEEEGFNFPRNYRPLGLDESGQLPDTL
jgi:hypothetical protein